ncbi:protein kinase [Sphaerisporangium sp. B11E5]|uniref:WD40 repeat domain-containing serine/threonine protein kinase n=1 Tax=Sphaerisporangium sp. B11E5 TaxID=3153563 RepID=UPI00325CD9D1
MNGELLAGRYRLIELLGEGGMGRVWRARDETLNRQVAVKQLVFPRGMDPTQRQDLGRRAIREARAAAKLNHPGIVTVYDVLTWDQAPVIVMEFVDGPSLAQVVAREGRLPPARVARIGVMLLEALTQAHEAGIVHRDLKPANVLLAGERVVITDFGIAHLAGEATLTASGAVIGTPAFMAPEQARALPVTSAWDLWSLGATMYAATEGRPPYTGITYAILASLLSPAPAPEPEHAGPLAPVLSGLMRKDPAQRMTVPEATKALTAIVAGRPVRQPARRWDTSAGRLLVGHESSHDHSHTSRVNAVAVGRLNGRAIAVSAGGDRTVRTWDLVTHRQLGDALISDGTVHAVAVGELEGRTVAVTGGIPGLQVWDLMSGRLDALLTDRVVHALAVTRLNGRAVAVISAGDDLSVRDLATGEQLGLPMSHTENAHAIAVSRLDGRAVAVSCSYDGTAQVWDLATGRQLSTFTVGAPYSLRTVATARMNGSTIGIAGSFDGLWLWDLATGRHLGRHRGAEVNVLAVCELDGRPVALVAGRGSEVRVVDVATGRQLGEPMTGHTDRVNTVAVGEIDGRAVAVTGGDDRNILLWEVSSKALLGRPLRGRTSGHTADVRAVAIGRLNGETIAVTGGADQTVRVWDLAAGRQLGGPMVGHTSGVRAVAVAQAHGETVAVSAGGDLTIRVWDLVTGRQLGEPMTTPENIGAMAVGAMDGRAVVVAGGDRWLWVWELAPGLQFGEPVTMRVGNVYAVAVSELDGRLVAVISDSRGLRIWDLAMGRKVRTLIGAWRNSFSLGGHTVVVGKMSERTVAVIGLSTGLEIRDLATGRQRGRVPTVKGALAVGELNGRTIAVTSGRYRDELVLLDLAAGRQLSRLPARHNGKVNAVAVGRMHGRAVAVTGGDDGSVWLWDLGAE